MRTIIFSGLITIGFFSGWFLGIKYASLQSREKNEICLPLPLPVADTLIYQDSVVYVIGGYAIDFRNIPKDEER